MAGTADRDRDHDMIASAAGAAHGAMDRHSPADRGAIKLVTMAPLYKELLRAENAAKIALDVADDPLEIVYDVVIDEKYVSNALASRARAHAQDRHLLTKIFLDYFDNEPSVGTREHTNWAQVRFEDVAMLIRGVQPGASGIAALEALRKTSRQEAPLVLVSSITGSLYLHLSAGFRHRAMRYLLGFATLVGGATGVVQMASSGDRSPAQTRAPAQCTIDVRIDDYQAGNRAALLQTLEELDADCVLSISARLGPSHWVTPNPRASGS